MQRGHAAIGAEGVVDLREGRPLFSENGFPPDPSTTTAVSVHASPDSLSGHLGAFVEHDDIDRKTLNKTQNVTGKSTVESRYPHGSVRLSCD